MSDFCGSAVLHKKFENQPKIPPSLNQPCITCLQTYLNNELPLHRVSRLQNPMVRGTLRNHDIRIADNLSISLWVLKPKGSPQGEQMLLEGVPFKRSNTLRQKFLELPKHDLMETEQLDKEY
ncbi:hypothetical protein GQX74_007939 [Glossina fuscipes]|nr:hypothetical protein GQX74_007939 [Glossina fuscipes]